MIQHNTTRWEAVHTDQIWPARPPWPSACSPPSRGESSPPVREQALQGGRGRRRRRSLADHEGENAGRTRKQGPLCSKLLKSLVGALFCFARLFSPVYNKVAVARSACFVDSTNVSPPAEPKCRGNPRPRIRPGGLASSILGRGQGRTRGKRAPGVKRGAASCPPRSSSPSRRPARPTGTAARYPTFSPWIFLFLVFGSCCCRRQACQQTTTPEPPRPSRQVYFCLSVRPGRKYDRTSHTTRGNVRRAVVLPFANVSMFGMSPDFWDIFIYTPCPCQVPVSWWQSWPGSQY